MTKNFYTPSEIAQILGVPHRCILEQLAAGEIEAELDPRTGRWKIPKSILNGTETTGLTEAEAAWQHEKALLLAELHRERARADRERERANREQEKAARELKRAEGLRSRLRELKAERSKGVRRRLFGG
ncbi:MAG: hypothetical protein M3M97_03395 [Actinomycetota bacterium]|nr:hypothetical protein [Actinomycetota bacterium]